jgi:hypothetical protein
MNRQLERIIKSIVNVKVVYSNEVQSRRIEGQFGGEMIRVMFSEIIVYIQYSPKLIQSKVLEDVVDQCKLQCKRANAGLPFASRHYLFNNINDGITLIDKRIFLRKKEDGVTLLKAIEGFEVGEDIRVLNKIFTFSNISNNTLCVFITDDMGCELSDHVKMRYRRIHKQSIWISIDEENVEVKKGIPILNIKSVEEDDV